MNLFLCFTRWFHEHGHELIRDDPSMLGEYKVSRCTRQCHHLKRPLREGEWYYSVVLESGDDFVRQDYAAESWSEPPDGAVGWWKCRMPTSDEKKMVLAPIEVLTDLLRQMGNQPEKAKSRYLLALMLMRKRVIRPVETDEAQVDLMQVEVIATGAEIDIPVCVINRGESEQLREELDQLLYCEAEEMEVGGQQDEASEVEATKDE
ncbi:MAG: hypothetical protein ACR2OA_10675 [Rubripirellula sp.]